MRYLVVNDGTPALIPDSQELMQREALGILIGWKRVDSKKYGWINPQGYHEAIHGNTIRFNPFTNVADDYEILRWFWSRRQKPAYHIKFASSLKYGQLYKVGDHARAMLVLKKDWEQNL